MHIAMNTLYTNNNINTYKYTLALMCFVTNNTGTNRLHVIEKVIRNYSRQNIISLSVVCLYPRAGPRSRSISCLSNRSRSWSTSRSISWSSNRSRSWSRSWLGTYDLSVSKKCINLIPSLSVNLFIY